MIAKFRRSDGVEFETVEGSASFELMTKDGGFARIDTEPAKDESERLLGAGSSEKTGDEDPPQVDLKKLNKTQLLEEAAKAGVEASEEMTKAQIIAAIEAKANPTE